MCLNLCLYGRNLHVQFEWTHKLSNYERIVFFYKCFRDLLRIIRCEKLDTGHCTYLCEIAGKKCAKYWNKQHQIMDIFDQIMFNDCFCDQHTSVYDWNEWPALMHTPVGPPKRATIENLFIYIQLFFIINF